MIFTDFYFECLFRLGCSLLCGFCFGLERKLRQHTVGLRTLILISLASCLLSILSVSMANQESFTGDPTRIAAGVITGIGFLGAGAILYQGMNIRGLTSAAIIFTVAAIGLGCGAGLYVPAFATLFLSLATMSIMGKIEHRLFPAEKRKKIEIEIEKGTEIDEPSIRKLLTEKGLIIHDMDVKVQSEPKTCDKISNKVSDTNASEKIRPGSKKITVAYTVKAPDSLDSIGLIRALEKITDAAKISISGNVM